MTVDHLDPRGKIMYPAGWYPDPQVPHQLRWWDGTAWTADVQAAPPAQADDTPAAPAHGVPAQAHPTPGVPAQAHPTPGDPAQAHPTPGVPAQAHPTPGDPATMPPSGAYGAVVAGTSATAVHGDPAGPAQPPERRRSTGPVIAVVGGIAALVLLAGVALWLSTDGFGGTDEPATFQSQSTSEMDDFARELESIGEDRGFTVDLAFGYTDDPATSDLHFNGQACERRAEVDHVEAIAGLQMLRPDGGEAFLGVGFGNDADFHAMVSELISGIEECRDGREIDALNSLTPPQNVITDEGNPAKVRLTTDITSMGHEQTMLLLVYADGPSAIQVVMAAPGFVEGETLDQLVDDAEDLLDAAIEAIDGRGYLTTGTR